jgi:hypothetical protein
MRFIVDASIMIAVGLFAWLVAFRALLCFTRDRMVPGRKL